MILADVVASVRYKPGWSVALRVMHGKPHLWIRATVPDSNPPHEPIEIDHIRPVPDYAGELDDSPQDRRAALDVVLKAIMDIEHHEIGEWLRVGDERPFYPAHGDEGDPYTEF